MRSSDLPLRHLLKLNEHLADTARHWRWVVRHMDHLGFARDDPQLIQATRIRDMALQAASDTHRLLMRWQADDYRKAASAGRTLRAKMRDRRQLGD